MKPLSLLALLALFKRVESVQCEPGTYSNSTTSTNGTVVEICFACTPGTYQNEAGSSDCKPCPSGTFQTEFGANSCNACAKGTYAVNAGTFNNETGASSQDACIACDAGQYAPNTGSVECIPCPYPLSSANGSEMCSFCKAGFYMNNNNVTAEQLAQTSIAYCKECPRPGTDCSTDNTSLDELPVRPGFWRASPYTATLYHCNNENVCVGYQGQTNPTRLPSERHDIYCAENHTGPLCEVCVNYPDYFDQSTGRCTPCPSSSGLFLRGSVAFMIALAIVLISSLMISRLSAISLFFTSLNVQAKVKILIGFYQIMSTFREVYGVSMHDKVQTWFDNLIHIFSLDFFQLLYIPKDCLGNSTTVNFLLSVCWPYVLCSVLIALLLFCVIIGERMGDARSTDVKARFGMKSLYIVIVVFYFALPTVSRTIIGAINCRTFETNDATREFRSYLVFSMDIECDASTDKNYSTLLSFFWVSFILWPCVVPLLLLLLLTKVYHSVKENRPTQLANTCRFLWEDFDETSTIALHWDIIDIMRKIFLTGFINFFGEYEGKGMILRLSMATVVSSLYLAILARVRPYKRTDDFYLSLISSFLLVVCFALGVILHICGDETGESCHFYVGSDSYKASIVVTSSAFGMLLIVLSFLIDQVYRAPIVRLKSTGHPPNLEMPTTCKYHLFLSHVWSSGQDKTHTIARTLQLYLPRLRIWLDVDELDDVDRLEEYIAESAVVLIFYSKGYFRSQNCRKEFYKAAALGKSIIVLYDGSEGVVEEMKAECVMYCDDGESRSESTSVSDLLDILSNGPICWLKEGTFSAESLKLVYLRVFRNLPFYQDINHRHLLDKGLSLPSDAVNVSLSFSVQLLVCEKNVGARDLAIEIQCMSPNKVTIKTLRGAVNIQEQALQERTSAKSVLDIFPIIGTFPVFGNDDLEEGFLLSRRTERFEVDSLVKNKEACDDDLSEDTPIDIGFKHAHLSGSMVRDIPLKSASGCDLARAALNLPLLRQMKEERGESDYSHSSAKPMAPNDWDSHVSPLTEKVDPEIENDDNLSLVPHSVERSTCSVGEIHLDCDISITPCSSEKGVRRNELAPEYISLKEELHLLADQKQVLLLYLNIDTFDDSGVADIVKVAKQKGIEIILVHEQDVDKGGCPFSYVFDHTPEELTERPYSIFRDIAIPLFTREEYRKISLQKILHKIEGADKKKFFWLR